MCKKLDGKSIRCLKVDDTAKVSGPRKQNSLQRGLVSRNEWSFTAILKSSAKKQAIH